MLQQADAQNQFVKEMNNMGAMAGTTSGKLTDLARDAGYASYDLGKLTDIVKGVGTGITLYVYRTLKTKRYKRNYKNAH